MRVKIISVYFLALSLLAFTSCEKDAKINIPDYQAKLVLYSIISPSDTVLYAYIETTRNLYTQYGSYSFNNLKVNFIDEDSTFQFTRFDTIGLQFKLKHKVYPGREYKITATCDGFKDISAQCRIPDQKQIEIMADTVSSEYGLGVARVDFLDDSDEISYYLASAYDTEYYPEYQNEAPPPYSSACSLIDYNSDLKYPFNNVQVYLDNYAVGKLFTTEFYSNAIGNIKVLQGADITGIVMETDKNYYMYFTSLKKYQDPGNPFVEFSQVYTNVTGGYGVFACYNRYEKTVKIK